MRWIGIVAAAAWLAAAWPAAAWAGFVAFDLDTEAGPATLTLDYDEAALGDRLKFQGNQVSLADILDIRLVIGGQAYELAGPLGGEVVLDRKAGTLTYIASDAALAAGAPSSQITLFFGGRVKVRRFSDLVAFLFDLTPEEVEILLTQTPVPIPLPGAAWLFAGGALALRRARRAAGDRALP